MYKKQKSPSCILFAGGAINNHGHSPFSRSPIKRLYATLKEVKLFLEKLNLDLR